MGKSIRILMVEDNPFDVELIVHVLRSGGFDPQYACVDNHLSMRAALNSSSWDLVTCDHSMPEFSAPEALELLQSMRPDIPIIIVSGEIDLALAVSLMKKGAWDYVQKSDLERLPLSIERELENANLMQQQQASEKALQNSEQNLRMLFENSYDAMIIHDLQGCIREANGAFIKLFGVGREEALGAHLSLFTFQDMSNATVQAIWERTLEGQEGLYEMNARRYCDGFCFDIEVGIKRIIWQGQNMIYAAIRDMSERQSLKLQLAAQEEINRLVTNNIRDALWIVDMDLHIVWASTFIEDKLGYSRDELLDMPLVDHLLPESRARAMDDLEGLRDRIRSAAPGEEVVFSGEYEYRTKDRGSFWSDMVVSLLHDEKGQGNRLLMVGRDITDRRRAEQTLREREALLAALVEHLPLDFWVRDREGKIILQSRWGQKLWGAAEGLTIKQMGLEPSVLARWEQNLEGALQGELIDHESRYLIEGQERFFREILAPVLEDGKSISVVGANVDLSELRQTEGELRESLALFSLFAGMITDCMFYARFTGSRSFLIEWHYGYLENICGYSFDQFKEQAGSCRDLIHPGDVALMNRALDQVASRQAVELEYRILHPDGRICWVRNCMSPAWSDEEGRVVGFHSVIRTIDPQEEPTIGPLYNDDFYLRMYENLADAAYILEPGGRFRLINQAGCRIIGCSPEEAQGLHLKEVLLPEDYEIMNTRIWSELKTHGSSRHQVTVLTRKGQRRIWDCVASLIYRPGGAGLIHGIARDITDQNDMRRQLQESEQLYKSLVEVIPQGVYRMDLEGNIIYSNDNALQMFGYVQEDLDQGMNIKDLFLPREYERVQARVQAIAAGEQNPGGEYLYLRKDGSVFFGLAYVAPVIKNGQIVCMQGTVLNIDERKRMENELLRLNNELEARVEKRTEELEELNRELEAFSYMAGHDLRAPLRAIAGFTGILARELGEGANQEVQHLLEVILGNVDRMGLLIDDLLKFSRINRQSMSLGRVDMNKLAHEVCREIQGCEESREVLWTIADLHEARCDRGLMRQVLHNLFANAWKYTRKSDIAMISIRSAKEGSEVIYTVEDNGVGFNMKYYDRLFSVFKRLHSQDDFEGTGVGLAIVQRIVNRHGGRIWAESEPMKGASFHFSLPAG